MRPGLIYFDHNATTRMKPEVARAMLAAMDQPRNPSSVHAFGREARRLVEEARTRILDSISAHGYQLIFTSSGTEANNLALRGMKQVKLLFSAIEHVSVLKSQEPDAVIPVTENGVIDLNALVNLVNRFEGKVLVSVMLANNETGVIQPLAEVVRIVHAAGGLVHTDAVQAYGKMPVDMKALDVDLMTISAHKIGGPQGVGALIAKKNIALKGEIRGGGQELGLRAGTENVAAIVGFGLVAMQVDHHMQKLRVNQMIRDRMEATLKAIDPRVQILGSAAERLPNTSCIVMPGVKSDTQLMHFDLAGIAVSSGSACSSGKVETSHVLKAMGLAADVAENAIRVSLGTENMQSEIDRFCASWRELFQRAGAKEPAPTYEEAMVA